MWARPIPSALTSEIKAGKAHRRGGSAQLSAEEGRASFCRAAGRVGHAVHCLAPPIGSCGAVNCAARCSHLRRADEVLQVADEVITGFGRNPAE